MAQNCTIGTIWIPNGGGLYGGGNPCEVLSNPTSNGTDPGYGVRMGSRVFHTWFDQCFATTTSIDTKQWNAGFDISMSVSNFSQSGFTYLKGTSGLYDTSINNFFTRLSTVISGFGVNTAGTITGASYGGKTRSKLRWTLMHEMDATKKAGAYGSSVANTPAEFQDFWRHFVDLAYTANVRQFLDMTQIFTSTGVDTGRVPTWIVLPKAGVSPSGHVYVDTLGSDRYIGFDKNWVYQGNIPAYPAQLASDVAAAKQYGLNLCFPEFSVAESGNDSQMQTYITGIGNSIAAVTDVAITGLWWFGQASNEFQNINKLASEDTVNHIAHLGKYNGITAMIAALGSNAPITGTGPVTPTVPANIQGASASDGKSIVGTWDAYAGSGDQFDAYLQQPTGTFPVKDNATPFSPAGRTYTFSKNVAPGQSYKITFVASNSTSGLRSGFGAIVPVQTLQPGSTNTAPIIDTAGYSADPANPFSITFAGTAHDPDSGQTLTYDWKLIDPTTGAVLSDLGAGASVNRVFSSAGAKLARFYVSDNGSPVQTTTRDVAFTVSPPGSAFTAFLNLQALQPGEDVRNIGIYDRQSKAIIDAAIQTLWFQKNQTNAQLNLSGSSCQASSLSGSTTITPVAGDLVYALIKMEGSVISAVAAALNTVIQVGTGLHIGFWDNNNNPILDFANFDAWLNQAGGNWVQANLPQQITGFTPGDLVYFGVWHPSTLTTFPQHRVAAGGTPAALGNQPMLQGVAGSPVAAPAFGRLRYGSAAAFPTGPLDFTKYLADPQVFLGFPLPYS